MVEHRFKRPCCWEDITMVLDTSVEEQSYVEDCEVCCRPLTITYRVDSDTDQVTSFTAEPG